MDILFLEGFLGLYQIPVRIPESLFSCRVSLEEILFLLQLGHEVKIDTTTTPIPKIKILSQVAYPYPRFLHFPFPSYICACMLVREIIHNRSMYFQLEQFLLSFAIHLYHTLSENRRLQRNTKGYWIPESGVKLLLLKWTLESITLIQQTKHSLVSEMSHLKLWSIIIAKGRLVP